VTDSRTRTNDVAKMPRTKRRRNGHEAKRDALRARVASALFDLGHVLMESGL